MASSSVKVAVRARPLNRREIDMGAEVILSMQDENVRIINKKLKNEFSIDKHTVKNPFYEKQFSFDHAYWSVKENDRHFTKQEQIYNDLGADVVKSALLGYNACIFAYGQTGAGKTFTMMGTSKDKGLIPRISENLFACFENSSETSCRVEISYIEIYNEQARDLLRPGPKTKKQDNLRIREHPKEGPFVQGATVNHVSDFSQMEHYINEGNSVRSTAATMMNDTSSRSHAIFCVKFTQARFSDNVPSETVSKINLVDLAGSERASASGATGVRLKEGGSINKSLSTLGLVISTLAENSSNLSESKHTSKRNTFVPYRDSVLTWLLKDSLGGNSKTIMIAAISPADINYGETLSTLRYASRAMKIINRPTINEDPNVKLIRELRAEIERLKAMIQNSPEKDPYSRTVNEAIEAKLAEEEKKADELTQTWRNKWKETETICQEEQLIMRRRGKQTLLISEKPHLVGINVDPLSAEIVIYRLESGVTIIGSEDLSEEQGIALQGSGIEKEHCHIVVGNDGSQVYMKPVSSKCFLNGNNVEEATALRQGDVVQFGDCLKFRFNNPIESSLLLEKRRSGNFTAELSLLYPKDRSLDSGLSCPDYEAEDSGPLPFLQDHGLMASCPDLTIQQNSFDSPVEYAEADSQTSPKHSPLRRTLAVLPDVPEEERYLSRFNEISVPVPDFSSIPRSSYTSTPISNKGRRWSHGDRQEIPPHLAVERNLSFNKEDFDSKRDLVRGMMNEYRSKEAKRIEGDRSFRTRADKERKNLELLKNEILEARKRNEEALLEHQRKLKECKRNAQAQKEERRMRVEKYVDSIVDSMKKKGNTTPEMERELSRRKFQIRSKIEEFWKKMDLYENCLLSIEMERKSSKTEVKEKKREGSSNSKSAESKDDGANFKEKMIVLEELLLRHREAYVANQAKIKHIDSAVESCKKKYQTRLEQSNSLLKELKDQKALTTNLIDQEQTTEDARLRSHSDLVHTLRYVNSVSSPLHLEQEVYAGSDEKGAVFTYSDVAFEENVEERVVTGNGHDIVCRTPSKTEKLEVRRDKYNSMIRDTERSIIELKNARALELDQYGIEKAERVDLCKKIEERIENDRSSLMQLAEEAGGSIRMEQDLGQEPNTVDVQKRKLLESRMKIVELFEKSLQSSLNDASTEMKELQRTGWGGFSLSRMNKYSGINDFLTCIMKSVEVYNLDEIAETEAEVAAVKESIGASETKLKEIEDKEASLQSSLLRQLEKRKVRSDLARVKHYQEISRSVEQLLTIAEGKDPSKVTMHLSKEAQHLAKSREKLEELEKSMISKVKESKDLQQKMKTAQMRMQSTSSDFEEFDDAVDCKMELELEELECKKEECDNDIADLHKRLEDERNQYLDILRCQDDYVIIGKEYRVAREIMLKVLGNQAAADVQKEVFWASNAIDLIEKGMDPSESPVCGGWRPFAKEKDVTILKKLVRNGVQCFIGCGIIRVPPHIVWESVRNPLSRFSYDSLLKKINIVEHISEQVKVVYMRHEGRVCVMKHSRDACMIHAERDQGDMMIAASQSVEHPDCPELPNIVRIQLLPSGWAIEPHFGEKIGSSLVWYIVKVNLGGSLPTTLLNFLCRRLPLSIAYLRSYLTPS